MTFCFAFLLDKLLLKGRLLYKGRICSGSKFFPYRVDPISEGDKINLTVVSPERVSITLMIITVISHQ